MRLNRQSVETVVNLLLRLVMLSVTSVVQSLYLFYHHFGQDQQSNKKKMEILDPVASNLYTSMEKARQFWCSIKSCQFDTDDPDLENDCSGVNEINDQEILSEDPPRHVLMRNCCLSASSLLEAANQAAQEREAKKIEDEKNKQTLDVILVPLQFVTGLIGSKGSRIKEIETLSNTRIRIQVEDNDPGSDSKSTTLTEQQRDRLCVIRGKLEDVHLAQGLIQEYIASNPVVIVKEIYVPKTFVGRIIGKKGETRRRIQQSTKVKFNVEQGSKKIETNMHNVVTEGKQTNKIETGPSLEDGLSCIVIRGTQDQIVLAENMMSEIIQEAKEYRRNKEKEQKTNLGSDNNSRIQFNCIPLPTTSSAMTSNNERVFHGSNGKTSKYRWTAKDNNNKTTETQVKDKWHWYNSSTASNNIKTSSQMEDAFKKGT